MFKKVKYLTTVANAGFKTSYFYLKDSKTIVPVDFSETFEHKAVPNTLDTLRRVFQFAHLTPAAIKLYMYRDNLYYTYMTFKTENGYCDLNISFKDALYLYKTCKVPVFVSESVLQQCGVKITKEMIEQAMQTG